MGTDKKIIYISKILGTSFQQELQSPVSQTSDEMTQGFGKLEINMDSSVRNAWKCERSKNFPFHSTMVATL